MNVKFITKDQNWQDETTIYWFSLVGTDSGTGCEMNGVYGIADCNGEESVVDCDGCPLTPGDWETIAVERHAIVTDAERMNKGD